MIDMTRFGRRAVVALAACTMLATTACVQVDTSKDGKNNDVKIQTPVGGLHVKTNDMAASDVGLPLYPGAVPKDTKGDKDQAADIHLGFGEWQLRVKVVKYHTTDSPQQVLAFYRKALGRYGDVIQCSGNTAVGTPTETREGLGCKDDESQPKDSHPDIKIDTSSQLKAGSKKHQHLVGIENSNAEGTEFSLIVLDLPTGDPLGGKDETRESN
jgi:hypothetical protein